MTADLTDENFKTWQCMTCGYIYDESAGDPLEGLPPGTRWKDIPDDWKCPSCGAAKLEFEMVELD
jgi:rubredoxin